MKKIKVYVGCSLTHSTDEFKKQIEQFKNKLRKHIVVLDFLGLGAPSAQIAFQSDVKCVREADLIISDFTNNSIGAGIEWGIAFQMGKPIITIAQKGAKVSRFPFGHINEKHVTYRYETLDDAYDFVITTINKLFA